MHPINKKSKFKENLKIIAVSLCIGLAAALFYSYLYSEKIHAGISGSVIRFHVLANSDDAYDQSLKLLVRDAVLDKYSALLESGSDLNSNRTLLQNSLNDIEALSGSVLAENGCYLPVNVSLSKSYFPTKTYADIVFPAGEYEALKIEIGESEGENWWCVMFPPLCFVDITQNEVSGDFKQNLKDILTDDEYGIVVKSKTQELLPVSVKFKIVEVWQQLKNTELYAFFD